MSEENLFDDSLILGAIFDVDGTLVDSNDAHAFEQAFNRCGYPLSFDKIRPLIGMGGDKLIRALIGEEEARKTGDKVAQLKTEIFLKDYLPNLAAFPYVRELLLALKDRGIELTVASGAGKEELEGLLRIAKVDDLFHSATNGEEAASKPDPDSVCKALKDLGLPQEKVLMVGDTPYDAEAARGAGIRMIGFRTGGWNTPKLGTEWVYDGPQDLLDHLDDSILGVA